MNKKELRKELEIVLSKTIHETLNKHNALAVKTIKKPINEVSKLVAKKFYKAIKALSEKENILKKTPANTKPDTKKASPKKKTRTVVSSKKGK